MRYDEFIRSGANGGGVSWEATNHLPAATFQQRAEQGATLRASITHGQRDDIAAKLRGALRALVGSH